MAELLEMGTSRDDKRNENIIKEISVDQERNDSSLEILFPDRLSDLPDIVLLHIMSFFPSNLVVRTSCLSKRWRYLWAATPNIYLSQLKTAVDRVNFMDRFLILRPDSSKIRKFEVVAPNNIAYANQVDTWIAFAVRHDVEELYLIYEGCDNDLQTKYETPHCIFNCGSLVTLSLIGCHLGLPTSMHLSSLTKLYLEKVYFSADTMKHLTSSCPLLQDLIFAECNRDVSLNILVANSQHKSLTIKECFGWNYSETNMEICAPNLLSLKFDGDMARERYYVKDLSSLVVASFSLGNMWCFDDSWWGYMLEKSTSYFELLDQIHHVRVLELCSWSVMNLSLREVQGLATTLPYNITTLELQTGLGKTDIPGIAYMLRNFTSLEVLIIHIIEDRSNYDDAINLRNEGYDESKYWNLGELSFSVILQHMKTIKINNFLGSRKYPWQERSEALEEIIRERANEFEFVRFLLEAITTLEMMSIDSTYLLDLSKEKPDLVCRFTSRLMNLPRASPIARICILEK